MKSHQQLVTEFFAGVTVGKVDDSILSPELTFWSITSGESDKARFELGMRALFAVVDGQITYDIKSITAEDDRAVAEIHSHGRLIDGHDFDNNHVFLFTIHNGLIEHVREYMNQEVVRNYVAPLMQKYLASLQ